MFCFSNILVKQISSVGNCFIKNFGIIKVYVHKLFKLKNDGKKEERQCTLKGQARYVNVRGSVHWKGVYRVEDRDLGVQNFFNWFL